MPHYPRPPFTSPYLCVDVHIPPQGPQRPDQELRVAVDAHPHPVDKHLGGLGDHTARNLRGALRKEPTGIIVFSWHSKPSHVPPCASPQNIPSPHDHLGLMSSSGSVLYSSRNSRTC